MKTKVIPAFLTYTGNALVVIGLRVEPAFVIFTVEWVTHGSVSSEEVHAEDEKSNTECKHNCIGGFDELDRSAVQPTYNPGAVTMPNRNAISLNQDTHAKWISISVMSRAGRVASCSMAAKSWREVNARAAGKAP